VGGGVGVGFGVGDGDRSSASRAVRFALLFPPMKGKSSRTANRIRLMKASVARAFISGFSFLYQHRSTPGDGFEYLRSPTSPHSCVSLRRQSFVGPCICI
jgi:hypothetical protein